ncbi:nuclease-related domain-containing protein [Bacillus marasmi]|uniref:nuclease-related domain-containing protein n=1 Tax=Bacillus marasmi TaxID=1926279 RepID=UPI0011CA1C90|nr:nuclease-related domain-containing protein [Bacillus marasmi]
MAYKNREESSELKILHILNARMDLTQTEKQHYLNLKKGFQGEVQFDQLVEGAGLHHKFYILNDLLLKCDNTTFQIDSTIITQNSIIPNEIKNFEGNLIYKNKNFYNCTTDGIYQNPLEQLNRIKILLTKLLQKNGFNIPIEGNVIFINPECFLYQAPVDEPIVYYTQLNRFLRSLNAKPSFLDNTHTELANFLLNAHITEPESMHLPAYQFGSVRKGLNCGKCNSFFLEIHGRKLVCYDCGYQEKIEAAVVRGVEEVRLLFPELKLTPNIVFDWCRLSISSKWLRRILKDNYEQFGYGKWTYYG